MSWEAPTVSDFKAQFIRDFAYAPSSDPSNLKFVIDADITNAIQLALLDFNPDLGFTNDVQKKAVFLYLAAFYLVENLKTSAQGLGSQCNFPVNGKTVAGVSLSFTPPDDWVKSGNLVHYTMNGYGWRYLSLVYPFTIGNVQMMQGTTTFQ